MFRTLSEKWLRRTSVRYNILQVRNLIGNNTKSFGCTHAMHKCIDIPKHIFADGLVHRKYQ